MSYKEQDREAIIKYISEGGVCDVAELTSNSGADKLRVYPILFELETEGLVKVVEREALGAPLKVELVK